MSILALKNEGFFMSFPANEAKKSPIIVTPAALEKIHRLILSKEGVLGVKIKVVSKGCGGRKYKMEYVEVPEKHDELVKIPYNGDIIKTFLDPKTLFVIIGTEIDYIESKFGAGFSFKNPREKGRCGCGESFYY